jgi:hypothetical protein
MSCGCSTNYISVGGLVDGKYRVHFKFFGTDVVGFMDRDNTLALVERSRSIGYVVHFKDGATMIGLLEEIGNGSEDTEV